MKNMLRNIGKALIRRRLELPPVPPGPPPFLGGADLSGRQRQIKAYQGWVFAAVNAIAQRVAGVPLRLFVKGEAGPGPEVSRHPVLDLFDRPNPIMTRRQFRFTLVTHLELTGMAFALMVENALKRPAELWPLSPADLIEIAAGEDTTRPITAFVFQGPGGSRIRYRPEEILYFRHPSPQSLIYGASPIAAMAHAYDIDLAVRVYQKNFFRNSARPEVVLATDQRLSDQEARRILTRWNQKHQGLAHVFEPTLLDGGLRVQPLAYSAKDFEFMALAGWTQDNILAAYQVPAGKLGLVKDVNRANAQGIDVTFNAECIRPRLDLIEDVLTAFLLPRYGAGLIIRHDNPVPTDRAQAHKEAMAQLDRGALTINEFRAGLGKGPVAWGDMPFSASPAPAEAEAEPKSLTSGGLASAVREAARRHYPRLLARFNGWSQARVEEELARLPGLLAPLVPAGADELGGRYLKNHFAACLSRGLKLDEALSGLESA